MVYVNGKLPDPSQSGATPTGPVTVRPASGSDYHVVAGSFLMPDRAQSQLKAIHQAGFPKAEVVQFPNSQFYSISVGSFETRKEADALKKQLQGAKIDAFVRANVQ